MPLAGRYHGLGFRGGVPNVPILGERPAILEVAGPPELVVPPAVILVVYRGTLEDMPAVGQRPDQFDIRRNDRLPVYEVDVLDADGQPVSLGGATAVFTLRARGGTLKVDRQAATIVVGDDGSTFNRLRYSWGLTDTDTAGRYLAEFEVTIGGLKRTFPSGPAQSLVIEIHDDLDAT